MRLLLFMIILSMVTCKKDQYQTSLSMNAAKWNKAGVSNYEYSITKICFCPVEYTGPFTVKVTNGQIESVNGGQYHPELTGKIWTISELFEYIKTSLDKKPAEQNIQYNSQYGYPESIYFDFDKQIADEEMRIEVKLLQLGS